jgi:hypothetical protein
VQGLRTAVTAFCVGQCTDVTAPMHGSCIYCTHTAGAALGSCTSVIASFGEQLYISHGLLCRAAATIARIRAINGDSKVEDLVEILKRISGKHSEETKALGREGTAWWSLRRPTVPPPPPNPPHVCKMLTLVLMAGGSYMTFEILIRVKLKIAYSNIMYIR